MKKIVTLGLSAIAATLISTSASAFFNRTVVDPTAESPIAKEYQDRNPEALAKFDGPIQSNGANFGEGGLFFFTYALENVPFTILQEHNRYLWENFMQYGLIMDHFTTYLTENPTQIDDYTETTAVVSVYMPLNKDLAHKVICEDEVRHEGTYDTDNLNYYKNVMCKAVQARIKHLTENPPEPSKKK